MQRRRRQRRRRVSASRESERHFMLQDLGQVVFEILEKNSIPHHQHHQHHHHHLVRSIAAAASQIQCERGKVEFGASATRATSLHFSSVYYSSRVFIAPSLSFALSLSLSAFLSKLFMDLIKLKVATFSITWRSLLINKVVWNFVCSKPTETSPKKSFFQFLFIITLKED